MTEQPLKPCQNEYYIYETLGDLIQIRQRLPVSENYPEKGHYRIVCELHHADKKLIEQCIQVWNTRAPVEPQPLKPCPFCGESPVFINVPNAPEVYCEECGIPTVTGENQSEVYTEWNTRAAPVEPQPAMELVEKVARKIAISQGEDESDWMHFKVEAQAALQVMLAELGAVKLKAYQIEMGCAWKTHGGASVLAREIQAALDKMGVTDR